MNNQVAPKVAGEGQSDLGEFVLQNIKIIIGISVLVLTLGLGFGLYKHQTKVTYLKNSELIYNFRKNDLDSYNKKSTSWNDFFKSYNDLTQKVKSHGNLLILAVDISSELIEKKEYENAIKVLELPWEQENKSTLESFFIGQRLAVALENTGKNKKALNVLEVLIKNPKKITKSRIYLDLARLHKKEGDIDQARKNLKYIVDTFPNNEEAKMAGIYLRELK